MINGIKEKYRVDDMQGVKMYIDHAYSRRRLI